VKQNNDLDISDKSKESILTAMEQEKYYKFYTNKAFDGGNRARSILEKSMLDKAKADRDEIKIQLNKGFSKSEIIKKYDTDENFKKWLNELINEIR